MNYVNKFLCKTIDLNPAPDHQAKRQPFARFPGGDKEIIYNERKQDIF